MTYAQDDTVLGVMLGEEFSEPLTVQMHDGSRVQLESSAAACTWSAQAPILLDQVQGVILPDGTQLEVPAGG